MADDGIHIKGFAIRGLLRYVKESDYPGGISALLEHLEPAAAPHFATKILSSRWYPYEAFLGLLHTIDARLGTLFDPEAFLRMMCMLGAYEVGRASDGSPLKPPGRLLEAAGLDDDYWQVSSP